MQRRISDTSTNNPHWQFPKLKGHTLSNRAISYFYPISIISALLMTLIFGDSHSHGILALYCVSTVPIFLLLRFTNIPTKLVLTLDFLLKFLFVAFIDVIALDWYQTKPFWYPDSNGFWTIALHFVEQWENGNFLLPWHISARNGLVTNFIWGIFIKAFGENIWIIPFSNIIFLSASSFIVNQTCSDLNLSNTLRRPILEVLILSPLTFYWILWGQKDVIVSFFLSLTANFFVRIWLKKHLTKSLLLLVFVAFLLWFERPYLSIFIIISIIYFSFFPSRFSNIIEPKIVLISLFSVLCCYFIIELFGSEIYYFFGYLLFYNSGEIESWTNNAAYVHKLARLLITPLPFKVELNSSVNILEIFGFFPNLFLQLIIFNAIFKAAKAHPRLLYVVLPYIMFIAFWAAFLPGYNRIRDSFIPMICCFLAFSTYISRKQVSMHRKEFLHPTS